MAWQDCFNDKFWVYICSTGIVMAAMLWGVPGASEMAYAVIGGMFGSAVGSKVQ
jgi:hypothetical protein